MRRRMTGHGQRARRLAAASFVLAALVLLVAAFRDIGAQWEHGMRGSNGAVYSDGAVTHTLRYGLGVTLGMPTFVVDNGGELVRSVNWHHPPLYWLYLALAAWVFGHENVVLRAAQLVLFLPGLFVLFGMLRRRAGDLPAAVASLFFASTPLVAYFGPMVIQDGAVLGMGLVTLRCFQSYIAAPSLRRWCVTALFFFLAASLDYPGYWWGPAMFFVALGSRRRVRALAAVLSLFPVAVLAFAVMAVHYGLEFGGPVAFVENLLRELGAEGHGASRVGRERVTRALTELLVVYGNGPILALALAGLVLGICQRARRRYRNLVVYGCAMTVPGLLNCGAMLPHAIEHVFWSVHGFAGLATLAAIVPLTALQRLDASRAWRVAGVLTLLLTGASAVFGVAKTHELVTVHAFVDNGTPAVMEKALPHLDECAWALTSATPIPRVYFGRTSTWYGVDTPEKLGIALALARGRGVHGVLGFVVAPQHRDTPLRTELDRLGQGVSVDDVVVYHLRL